MPSALGVVVIATEGPSTSSASRPFGCPASPLLGPHHHALRPPSQPLIGPLMSISSPSTSAASMIEVELVGSTCARVEGRPFGYVRWRAQTGVVPKVARELVREGRDPATVVRVTRKGTICFKDATLGSWASLCVEETDLQSVRFRKHRERDFATVGVCGGASGQAKALEAIPA